MGRGRQKAKHTKIARELKSFSPEVDYDQLERELGGKTHDPYEDEVSKWSEYVDDVPEDHKKRA
ncbi:DUF3073 domain-containing protein [Microbacterium sp. MPKO10]|uniref:DUF3073 domain-containing protein n=1 Tax=Microbacterium sp. MPKO10 TaxID=2989818 RepID=UPI002236B11C|nr:DUF3073 domain-containing protein [Microbacterium sp. MPKO10]MCW4458928.1 DUF3073 domain-containing protein [Microbacterium sp. MPKO10]